MMRLLHSNMSKNGNPSYTNLGVFLKASKNEIETLYSVVPNPPRSGCNQPFLASCFLTHLSELSIRFDIFISCADVYICVLSFA